MRLRLNIWHAYFTMMPYDMTPGQCHCCLDFDLSAKNSFVAART